MALEPQVITNEQDFAQVIDAANRNPVPLRVGLADNITISKPYTIRAPLSLYGPVRFTYLTNGSLTWQGKLEGQYTLQAKPFGETVQTDAPVVPGQYLLMQGDDKLPVEPHHYGGTQHPQELHYVNYSKAGTVGVESFTVDRMATSCSIMTPLDDVSVTDIECVFEDKTQRDYATAMRFDCVTNARVENVRFLRSGPGALWLSNAYGCRVQCRIDGTVAADNVYGLVVGTVNDVRFTDCTITGCRHAFTTTAGATLGKARWGTPLNVTLCNSTINVPTKLEIGPNATRVGIDTHAEGYGFTCRDLTVNVGSGTSNYGAFIRSRNAQFINCVFNGGGSTKAIEFYGPDGVVHGCLINNHWIGVAAKKIYGQYANHVSVTDTLFRNLAGPACNFESGTGHVIHNLAFDKCMTNPGAKFKQYTNPVIGNHQAL